MKSRYWLLIILLTLLILTACQTENGTPTAPIVPLEPSAAMQSQFDNTPPTATRLPYPSASPTRTPLMIADLTLIPKSTATPTPTLPAADSTTQANVLVSSLNVRQGPGVDYPIVGVVFAGEIFEIVGTSNSHWVQVVTAAGETGWISGKPAYTQITGALDDTPLVQVTPPNPEAKTNSGNNGKLVFMTRKVQHKPHGF